MQVEKKELTPEQKEKLIKIRLANGAWHPLVSEMMQHFFTIGLN